MDQQEIQRHHGQQQQARTSSSGDNMPHIPSGIPCTFLDVSVWYGITVRKSIGTSSVTRRWNSAYCARRFSTSVSMPACASNASTFGLEKDCVLVQMMSRMLLDR
ncbi:hypothetical protein G6F68_018478 [Rhizopus microsporus]|nr:hypothetical protein G6F68_018478 [Rhizopus microsporus]